MIATGATANRTNRRAGRGALLLVASAVLLLGLATGASAHEGDDETIPADTGDDEPIPAHTDDDETIPADTGDDLSPVYEIPEGADRIIGSPEAGPKPQQSGDRGGSLQFVTLGAVAAAVAFIMWRIARAVRRSSRPAPAESG